jgi:hypothetical protein
MCRDNVEKESVLVEDATELGLHRLSHGARGLSAATARAPLGVLINEVASAAASDVVVRRLLIDHLLLADELLVEAEDGALSLPVDVASAAAASAEVVAGGWGSQLGERGWALGVGAAGDVGWVDTDAVSRAATTVTCHGCGCDRWVWLGDAVVARHCGCCGFVVVWMGCGDVWQLPDCYASKWQRWMEG